MIIDVLLAILHQLLQWFLSVRPEWSITLPAGVSRIVAIGKAWDSIFPISEVLAFVSVVLVGFLAVHAVKWTIKLIDYVADVLP